jgi:hypothetical protein
VEFEDSQSALDSYSKNGFYIAKNVLPEQAIDDCARQLCRLTNSSSKNLEESLRKLFEVSPTLYVETLKTFAKSQALIKLFLDDRLLSLLDKLGIKFPTIPTQPVTHATCKELVLESKSLGFETHQDWPSIQGSLDSLVVWIPFNEVHEDNHPIQVLPGSHLAGLRDSIIKENISYIELSDEENSSMEDVICEPGDAVIFSTFTIHRTKLVGKGFRFSASLRFDNALEKTFIDRNFPCAYKRYVERSLSYIPKNDDIKKIFGK